MATLINRIQRAMLGSAGPEKVRALLIELAIPAGGSGANALREARRGFLRPISHEAILRNALDSLGLTGGGTGARPLTRIRSALLHNLVDSETTLRDGLNDLLGAADLVTGSGEGGEYSALAVHFDGATSLKSTDPLSVTDNPQGFFSLWLKPAVDESGIVLFSNGTFVISVSSRFIHAELADEEYNNFVYFDSDSEIVTNDAWNHIVFAWNTNFASGSRRASVYVDDTPVTLNVGDDEGVAFDVALVIDQLDALSKVAFFTEGDYADVGLWVGSTIVEADGTITEVNRRKFIDASGKPVDPTNWPANPVIKFIGNAASFATNQGSGGEFTVTSGSLTNASTSPSD